MAVSPHHARPAETGLTPADGARPPIGTDEQGIAGVASARTVKMAVVEHRRGPVGPEAASRPAAGRVLAHRLQARRSDGQEHIPRPVGLRQQHLTAGHDRAGGDDAEQLVGPPPEIGPHGPRCRIDYKEPIPHPGEDAVSTVNTRPHRRAVAGELVARPPALSARGQLKRHESAVEALHAVEPLRRRRRGSQGAAADLHDHQPLISDVDHQRRGGNAEKVSHNVIRSGRVYLPAAHAIAEAAAFEPSLGAKRDHRIIGDHRRRPRSAVVAERVDVVGGIPLLPEFPSRLGREASDPNLLANAVADHAPTPGHCGAAISLPKPTVPDDRRAAGRPRRRHA